MTNHLVGDVYAKIIEEVIDASKADFEEHGISSSTLTDLQKEWQLKLSQRGVAQMPWDPKPQPPPVQQPAPSLTSVSNGLPASNYGYNTQPNGGAPIKSEVGNDSPYAMNGYQDPTAQVGGLARAQQLVQAYHGNQGANNMPRGGLALPGQRPQGLQMPAQAQQHAQQQYSAQQRQQMMQQQAALQQQQAQPRIKVENDSPKFEQGAFQQQQRPPYGQTDGADDGLEEWQTMLAQRRAAHALHGEQADGMMREQVMQLSSDLQSGLMMPLDRQPNRKLKKQRRAVASQRPTSVRAGPSVPQLDGDVDDEEEKPDIKDEDDENAINSDLDDSDDEGLANIGEEDDEDGDTILCTYDKVQRVKNKWKCTLKDGVMSVNGKEWVFHKGVMEAEF